MKQYDLKAEVKHQIENDKHTFLKEFNGAVARETEKVTVSHKLIQRPHHFSNGKGRVAKKLTIVIDFNDAVIQPHSHFEDDFLPGIVDAIQNNVNGLYENQD